MKTKLYKLVSLLVLLSMLVVPVSAQYVPPAEDSSKGQAKGIGPVQQVEGVDLATPARYVVLLKDPSLVRYTGGIIGLNATNPTARGEAHLDVNSPDSQAYLAYLKAKRAAFLGEAEKIIQRGLQVDFNYDVVLNGLAVIITPLEAEKLTAMPGVRQVLRDTIEQVDTDAGPTWIGAPSIWNGDTTDGTESRGEGVIVGILDTGINFDHPSFADPGPVDAYDYPAPAGGYKGVCAVVGGPYENACNDKLIGAYSFTTETVTPEDAEGHGSHTASTVAGNVVNLNFMGVDTTISGVAPHAQIIAYDVCDPSGCSGAASAAAVQQAIIDGVNVINFSISGGRNPYSDTVELAFLDAFDAGVFVSASAGNLKTGEPSTNGLVSHVSPWVMTVAASSHNRKFTNAISVVSPVPPATFTDMGLLVGTSPIAFGALNDVELAWAGKDTSSSTSPFSDNRQGCNAFPAGFFTGDVALIRRGVCTFAAKVDNAAAAGAVGVLIYADTRPPTSPAGLEATTIPSGFLYLFPADAAALAAFVDANAPVLIDISAFGRVLNDAWGDIKADFSYRGPNPAFDVLKPDITAPGLEILAAVADGVIAPDPDAEFELYQGTSMSAPHVAGSAALLASLHPTWTPAEIKSALMLTTKNWDELLKENGTTQADPFDFGSGRVNLTNAALTGLVMDETTANFAAADPALAGDPTTLNLASLNSGQCVGACSFTRTFTSVAAGPAAYTVSVDAPAGMTITVTPATFIIPAGGTQEVTFDVDVAAMTADVWAFATVNFETTNFHPTTTFLSEDFTSASFPPGGWTRIEVDGNTTYQWARSTAQYNTDAGSAYHNYGNGSVTENGWLITPTFTAGDDTWLSFWEKTLYPADYAGHYVYVCDTTNDCSTPPTNWVQLAETGALPNTSWRLKTFDLSGYSGASVKVAFVYTGNYADGWYIDNVKIQDFLDGSPISNVHIPVAVMPTTGNLPGLVQFDSYRDAGAEVIPDLQAVAITDLTVDTYGFVKADLTQFNLAQDPTNDLPYDDLSQVYYQMIPIPDGAARFVAETIASTAPDVDLFWGYDFNGNGLPDANEQLGSSATSSAIEYVSDVWFPPLANDLWVVVQNWEGSGAPTDAITLAIGVVPYDPIVPPTMTVDGPASNPAGDLFDLTVYWHDIDTQEGDRLYGIFDIYTDGTYSTNVGYTEVDVIRKADDVTKTVDPATALFGDTLTYTITVAPNMTATDLAYTLKDTIPAGFLYVPGSVTGGATYNSVDNAIEWSGVMPGSTARQYVYTTSAEDPNCTLEIMADGTPNAYLDWKTTSYGFSTSSTISGDSFWYSTFSTYPAFNYYGTNYTGMQFTADGYAMFAGASPSAVNQMIPDPTLPNNVMAMMWDDLVVTYDAATNKGVTMVGDSATFATIEYDDVALKSDPTKTLDFEIGYFLQPDDTPGAYEIIFAYDNISEGFFDAVTATIGVENSTGTEGALFSYNDPALTIESGSAICYDWVLIVPEAKVITYQVTVDSHVTGDIANEVVHDNDALGSVPEIAKAIVNIPALALTDLDLLQSVDQVTWAAVPGTFAGGYRMTLDPLEDWYYLDADNLVVNRPLADGYYPFKVTSYPAGFFAYWAGRGVYDGAPGTWEPFMWEIINGNQPIFYLKVTGTDYMLVDGMTYLMGGGDQPLRINGDYLLGAYTFSGEVEDEFGYTDAVDVDITFKSLPHANEQTLTTAEDTPLPITLTADDLYPDMLTWEIVDQPQHGTLTGTAPDVTYTPALNYFGPDSFTFRVYDGSVYSNTAMVSITVTPVNDSPVAVDDFYSVDEDTTLVVAAPGVLANDIEVDPDGIAAVLVTAPAHGLLTLLEDGSFTYIPDKDFNGIDTFVYLMVTYPMKSWVDDAVVTITVNPVNDDPVADVIADVEWLAREAHTYDVSGSFSDVDGDTLTFSAELEGSLPLPSWLSFDSDTGVFSGTPTNNVVGVYPIVVTADDGNGGQVTSTFTLTVILNPYRVFVPFIINP